MIDKSPEKIRTMFNKIAPKYDFINNLISFFTHILIKKTALNSLKIEPDSKILDLCSGSGDLGRIIKKRDKTVKVIGVDFSLNMIEIAKKKNKDIEYFLQDATDLKFQNNEFNYVVMGFGLRNIENQDKAIKEIYRILDCKGKFLHLDFGKKNPLSKIYDKIVLLLINLFIKNKKPYLYLIESKNEFEEPKTLIEKFQTAGFKYISHKNLLFGIISYQIMEKN